MEAQSGDILGKAADSIERDLVRIAADVLALGQDAVGHRNDLATASFRLVNIDKLTRGRPQDLAVGLGGGLLTDSVINGMGSTPMSAMRPAKSEMMDGVSASTASTISSTCVGVKMVVTLTLMPSAESLRTSSAVDSPLVVTHGILT